MSEQTNTMTQQVRAPSARSFQEAGTPSFRPSQYARTPSFRPSQQARTSSERSMQTVRMASERSSEQVQTPSGRSAANRSSLMSEKTVFEDPKRESVNRCVKGPIVECGMSLIIVGNLGLIIVETDIRASRPDQDFPQWLNLASWSVLVIFVAELALRLFVARSEFFKDTWNTFDLCVIITDFTFSLAADVFGEIMPVSLLRVMRLAKLTRIGQVFRQFPELRLMMAGLIGAARAIVWGTVLIIVALIIVSVVAVQIIHPLNQDLAQTGEYDTAGCLHCADAYSSVFSSCLTFWQQIIAGDSWGMTTIPIVTKHPPAAVYFLAVYLIMGLALHNLILGVVVDAANQSRKALEDEMDLKHKLKRLEGQQNLLGMCSTLDSDKSGFISKEELYSGYESSEEFHKCMEDLDVQQADLEVVWLLMDHDRTGQVAFDEFVTQLFNMRNSESQFMLTYIKYYITQIKDQLLGEMQVVEEEMHVVQKELRRVETLEADTAKMNEKEMELIDAVSSRVEAIQARAGRFSGNRQKSQGGTMHEKSSVRGFQSMPAMLPEVAETVPKKEPKQQDQWAPFAECMDELRQHQASIMARLEAIDAKVEMSVSEQLRRARSSFWSLPDPCQNVPCQKTVTIIPGPHTDRSSNIAAASGREQTLLSTPDLQNARFHTSGQDAFTSQSRLAPRQSVGRGA